MTFGYPQAKKVGGGVAFSETAVIFREVTLCLSPHAFLTPVHYSFPGHLQQCHLLAWQTRETFKPVASFLCPYGLFLSHDDLADVF